MGEFELIQHYFKSSPCATLSNDISLGIGDDCALLNLDALSELAISTDTLVADVHFPATGNPFLISQRALAVTVSDLAAMGARPIGFTLALTLPYVDEIWLKAFAQGLSSKANECGIVLIGGDTTKGPLSITITVLGDVPKHKALVRSGAKVGDLLCVSGLLGEAAGALPLVLKGNEDIEPRLLKAYWSPTPQLALGISLRGKASACLDISDGLVGDCKHIAKASQVGLVIELDKLVISEPLHNLYESTICYEMMLSGGDDYQLAFTLAHYDVELLKAQYPNIQVIGRVVTGSDVTILDKQGMPILYSKSSYQHF